MMGFDPVFDSFLIHTCTIVQAGVMDAGYGHGATPDWDNPVVLLSGIAFRLMPRDGSARFNVELHIASAGTLVGEWLGFMRYNDVPAGLLAKTGSLHYRIKDVLDLGGSVVDAGPFDIRNVAVAAGDTHHVELSLRRIA